MTNVYGPLSADVGSASPGPSDTQALRALTQEGHALSVLVVSVDPAVLETVYNATPSGIAITHSRRVRKIAAIIAECQPSVLLYESENSSDVSSLLLQLGQNYPTLSVVIAGKREDGPFLMRLAASGAICRFLLLPLAGGQTRLALTAALRHHVQLKSTGAVAVTVPHSFDKRPWLISLCAMGAIALGAAAFIALRGTQPKTTTGSMVAGQSQNAVAVDRMPVEAQLLKARDAFGRGHYLEPQGDNALEFYRAVLAVNSSDVEALRGIRAVADKLLESAEAALIQEHLEAAIHDIEAVRDIDASHPRLAFFDAQVAHERERVTLAQMRDVSTRVQELLVQATERIQTGRLIAPAGANARDALVEARRLDSSDPKIASRIRELNSALVDKGRKALAQGNVKEARQLVLAAKELGSASAAVAALDRAIEVPRDAVPPQVTAATASRSAATPSTAGSSIDVLIAEVRQRLNDGKLLEPAGNTARDALTALRVAAPDRPEVKELARSIATVALVSGRQAIVDKKYERAAQLLTVAREMGPSDNVDVIAAAERDLNAARTEEATLPTIVQAIKLLRVKEVQPQYPKEAAKDGDEGWVEMEFTISTSGRPEKVKVKNARPQRVFDQAATAALSQWRFQPIVRNGEAVEQRATLTMTFQLK